MKRCGGISDGERQLTECDWKGLRIVRTTDKISSALWHIVFGKREICDRKPMTLSVVRGNRGHTHSSRTRWAASALCLMLASTAQCLAQPVAQKDEIDCRRDSRPSMFRLRTVIGESRPIEFLLCGRVFSPASGPAQLFVINGWGKAKPYRTLELKQQDFEEILNLYERALKFNTPVPIRGVERRVIHGDHTCLETMDRGGDRVIACFEQLAERTEERGLSGLLALRSRLGALNRKQ
jgi:hypothetical protein